MMRRAHFTLLWVLAAIVAGCSTMRTSKVDEFEEVRIDELHNNEVSTGILNRTLVCFNVRREVQKITVWTNHSVVLITNKVLHYVTNLVVTSGTNYQTALTTNVVQHVPGVETNELSEAIEDRSRQTPSTNVSIVLSRGTTFSRGSGQTTLAMLTLRQRSQQTTLPGNGFEVLSLENETLSFETNMVITVHTNFTITAVTNLSILPTNLLVERFYVILEYSPPDLPIQAGEPLLLRVDGIRYMLEPASPRSPVIPRRGFALTSYHIDPQLLLSIANAKQVKLRIKGINCVIEKDMSFASRARLRGFISSLYRTNSITPNS